MRYTGADSELCPGVLSGQGDLPEGHRGRTEHKKRVRFRAFEKNGGAGTLSAGKRFPVTTV